MTFRLEFNNGVNKKNETKVICNIMKRIRLRYTIRPLLHSFIKRYQKDKNI